MMLLFVLLAIGVSFGLAWLFWYFRYGPPDPELLPVLAYHKVDRRFEWGGTWNTPAQFRRQVDWLAQHGYRTIGPDMLFESGHTSREGAILITFEDAYESVYHNAYPVLSTHGFVATVFVITGCVGSENRWDVRLGGRTFRHMDWDQIQELKRNGYTIGSHTVSHRDLTRLPQGEVRRELMESKRQLEEKLGDEIGYLSYPFGRYTPQIQDLAREVGYRAAFAFCPSCSNRTVDPYAIRQMGIYVIDTVWDLRVKVDPASHPISFGFEDMKGRLINFCARGTPVVKGSEAKVGK
jgi:peptidoglycan/xylan/chitin deacetylase (PgdA/CDA1 family)